MELAPIVLFVYKRKEQTEKTINALLKNKLAKDSLLFIFSDAAKNEADIEKVSEVRRYIKSINGFKEIEIIERKENFGLSKNIINGVSTILNSFESIIVLEDDLETCSYFLEFMNLNLDKYRNESKVFQISGYSFPVKYSNNDKDCFFFPFVSTWGWATWKRAWNFFDDSMSGYSLLKKDKKLRKRFDINGSYPYFKMIENQINHKIDSWGIKWNLSVFMNNGLVLYPRVSLIENIGFNETATHTKTFIYGNNIDLNKNQIKNYPVHIEIDTQALKSYSEYIKKQKIRNLFNFVYNFLKLTK